MTTKPTVQSDFLPAIQKLSVVLGIARAQHRKQTPPPILLRGESHSPKLTAANDLPQAPIQVSIVQPTPIVSAPGKAAPATFQFSLNNTGLLSRALNWIRSRQFARLNTKRLHLAETISLGEKRFVAVIQVDGLQYLIGGGATNVALLARLNDKKSFGDLLDDKMSAQFDSASVPFLEQPGGHA